MSADSLQAMTYDSPLFDIRGTSKFGKQTVQHSATIATTSVERAIELARAHWRGRADVRIEGVARRRETIMIERPLRSAS